MAIMFRSAKIRAVALALAWAVMAMFLASGAFAGENQTQDADAHAVIAVEGAYMRTSGGVGKNGAAFMTIRNLSDKEDRLLSVSSPAARMTKVHTHIEDENGVLMMRPVAGGLLIPATGSHRLKRGGDHLMMMGLKQELAQGDLVTFVLVFEHAGAVEIIVPVDQARKN